MKILISLNLTVEDDTDLENLTQCLCDLVMEDWKYDLPIIHSVDDCQWSLVPNQ